MSSNIGYVRVSTKEQATTRQLDGVKLDRVYEDKISGVIKDRPQLTLCLEYLRSGDTLHVHSIDRLARSLRHLEEILELLQHRGVTVLFHAENLRFEPASTNPIATLMLHIIGAVAQFERLVSKTRQREGIEMTKTHGTKSGKPFGKTPLDMSRRDEAVECCKRGLNISQIAKEMKLSRASIYKLLA